METFVAKNKTFINTGLSVHYNAFVNKKRVAKKDIADKYELMKIVLAIFKEVGKQIVNSKGGVCIKNFGYFFVWKTLAKTTFGEKYKWNDKREQYNHHSNNYRYTPVFVSAGGPINLKFWSMDYKFSDNVKQGIKSKIKQGFEYKTYVFSLKKVLNLS